jgi:ABC-2 type transport system permease protein
MTMILFTLTQLVGNQFGFDRSGFRVFILCPAARGEILMGKNLAVAPLALALGLIGVGVLQAVYPMRVDHLFATLPALVSMYLIFCMMANCLAILAPMPIAAGTMRPANTRTVPVLLHLALTFILPVALAPVLLPLGLEVLAGELGSITRLPIHLALSLLECIGVIFLYRWIVGWQGVWLQAREQRILEIVAAKAE